MKKLDKSRKSKVITNGCTNVSHTYFQKQQIITLSIPTIRCLFASEWNRERVSKWSLSITGFELHDLLRHFKRDPLNKGLRWRLGGLNL